MDYWTSRLHEARQGIGGHLTSKVTEHGLARVLQGVQYSRCVGLRFGDVLSGHYGII